MKKRNTFRAMIAVVLLFTLMPSTVTTSSAFTSAPTLFFGTDSYGANIPDIDGIVVENQTITYDVQEFPYHENVEELKKYIGNVTTEYTFFNPTEQEIKMKLSYCPDRVTDYPIGEVYCDLEKYRITVNGDVINTELRYAVGSINNPRLNNFASSVHDEYVGNDFCNTDTTVTKYTYKLSDCTASYASAGFDIELEENKGSIFCLDGIASVRTQDDGSYHMRTSYDGSEHIYTLYVFGEELEKLPEWKVYLSSETDVIDGKMDLVSKETISFSDFAFKYYDEARGINKVDWFNIMATIILQAKKNNGKYVTLTEYLDNNFKDKYLSGFIYEITLKPGERIVNTISAPAYPDVETDYEPYMFYYKYYFPLANVEMFTGKINININTPYYVITGDNNYTDRSDKLEKSENGYSGSMDPIYIYGRDDFYPNGITFTLSEAENPEKKEIELTLLGNIIIVIIIILILPIVLIWLITNKASEGYTKLKYWVNDIFGK